MRVIAVLFRPALSGWIFLSIPWIAVYASEIPKPLTLEYALSRAEFHPELGPELAKLDIARSRANLVSAADDLQISLNGRLQWIEPSDVSSNQSHDDHKISLNAEKNLYDFGRAAARQAFSELEAESQSNVLLHELGLKRLDIMRRYFDVLLADLEFSAENEAIAIGFIRADRLEQRMEFGEVAELDVLEAQADYQLSLAARNAAQQKQRSKRALLAESLGLPGRLSDALEEPELPLIPEVIPDYQAILTMVIDRHPAVLAAQQKRDSARLQEDAARRVYYPTLRAYAEVADYSRTESGSDDWTLGFRIHVPLYQGGRKNARTAQARANARMSHADAELTLSRTRQNVLLLWQELSLLKLKLHQAQLELDARDLSLDKSRALYDMDVRSDLGDAMILFSRSKLKYATIRYELALVMGKLDLLTNGGFTKLTSQSDD